MMIYCWSKPICSTIILLYLIRKNVSMRTPIKNYEMNSEMTRLEQKIDVSRTTQMLERALISIFAVTIMAMESEQSHL